MSPVSSDTHLLRTGWGRRGCKRVLANECSIVSICKRRILLLICQIVFASQRGKKKRRRRLSEQSKTPLVCCFQKNLILLQPMRFITLALCCGLPVDWLYSRHPSKGLFQFSIRVNKCDLLCRQHNKLEFGFLCSRHDRVDRGWCVAVHENLGSEESWLTDYPIGCNSTSALAGWCVMSASAAAHLHLTL